MAKEVFAVNGADDTTAAALALGFASGCLMNVNEAIVLANLAAGIVVGKFGTTSVAAAELLGTHSRDDV